MNLQRHDDFGMIGQTLVNSIQLRAASGFDYHGNRGIVSGLARPASDGAFTNIADMPANDFDHYRVEIFATLAHRLDRELTRKL